MAHSSIRSRVLGPALVSLAFALPAVAQGAEPAEEAGFWASMLFTWGPVLFIIALWIYFMRKLSKGRQGQLVERSFEHMDLLEAQNREMIESLKAIERHLERR